MTNEEREALNLKREEKIKYYTQHPDELSIRLIQGDSPDTVINIDYNTKTARVDTTANMQWTKLKPGIKSGRYKIVDLTFQEDKITSVAVEMDMGAISFRTTIMSDERRQKLSELGSKMWMKKKQN